MPPPHHPSSNGQAECFVDTLKKGTKTTVISEHFQNNAKHQHRAWNVACRVDVHQED